MNTRNKKIKQEESTPKIENSIYLRVIDYGLEFPEGFTYDQIIDGLKLEGWERKIINEYLETAYKNYNTSGVKGNAETPFLLAQIGPSISFMHPAHEYIVSYDASFKFIDYHELRFARENAREARSLSIKAVIISVIAVLVSVIIPILIAQFMAQTVKIDESSLKFLSKPESENLDLQY